MKQFFQGKLGKTCVLCILTFKSYIVAKQTKWFTRRPAKNLNIDHCKLLVNRRLLCWSRHMPDPLKISSCHLKLGNASMETFTLVWGRGCHLLNIYQTTSRKNTKDLHITTMTHGFPNVKCDELVPNKDLIHTSMSSN